MDKVNLERMPSFITADGSAIRELAGPAELSAGARHQSLAEATLEAGAETAEHYHPQSEEIYHFVRGRGRMRLGDEETDVEVGDCVLIPPGTPHKLWNAGGQPLVLLCSCAPPYSDGDTVMTGR